MKSKGLVFYETTWLPKNKKNPKVDAGDVLKRVDQSGLGGQDRLQKNERRAAGKGKSLDEEERRAVKFLKKREGKKNEPGKKNRVFRVGLY